MSNHIAIAAVTQTLIDSLSGPLDRDLPGALIEAARPGSAANTAVPTVHLYLYRVEPNAAWRNADLPMRSSNGGAMERPQAALNLNYLFTFHGDEGALVPHRLLGSVVRRLHSRPVLSRDLVARTIQNAIANAPDTPLAFSDLADQMEQVRLTPLSLDLDQISNLWSIFPDTPYSLSVAYEASVVLISPDESASPALPVLERNVFVETIRRPQIDTVQAASGPRDPVTTGTTVVIRGSQLQGDVTIVWFGGVDVTPPATDVTDTRINLLVPANARAGMLPVRIEHRRLMGNPPAARSAGQSNAAPLTVIPAVRRAGGNFLLATSGVVAGTQPGTHSGTIDLTVDPAVGKTQQVTVHLTRTVPPPAPNQQPLGYSFPDTSRNLVTEPDTTNDLHVPFTDVRPGTYIVRVQVDGADSLLERDTNPANVTFDAFIAPALVIP